MTILSILQKTLQIGKRFKNDKVSNDYTIKDYFRRIPYLKKIKDLFSKN